MCVQCSVPLVLISFMAKISQKKSLKNNTATASCINGESGTPTKVVKRTRKSIPRDSPPRRSSIYRGVTRSLSFFLLFFEKKNYCHVVSIIKCREIFGELILYRTSCQLTLYLLLDGVWTSLKLDSHPIY